MERVLPKKLEPCRLAKGASHEALARAEQKLGFKFPADYKAALRESDGFEGFIGDGDHVQLWSASGLIRWNRAYRARDILSDAVLLGTNGGGEGYWLRKRGGRVEYMLLPLTGGASDCIRLATTFRGLIRKIGQGLFDDDE